ncbi:MAG: sigma-E factor negative regulatory protein [Proteobacteria bacterium]|nr:sigma-E factor negative regulatory protein [Pseudomonadota bacterium]
MQLSAYVDDELPQNEAELLLRRLSQDVKLRQEVAEYLAIGRVMRGEVGVAGIDGIRNRVLAAIDDTAGTTDAVIENEPATRALKPLVGVAIAATVALAAIFGLQQTTGVDDVVLQDGNPLPLRLSTTATHRNQTRNRNTCETCPYHTASPCPLITEILPAQLILARGVYGMIGAATIIGDPGAGPVPSNSGPRLQNRPPPRAYGRTAPHAR